MNIQAMLFMAVITAFSVFAQADNNSSSDATKTESTGDAGGSADNRGFDEIKTIEGDQEKSKGEEDKSAGHERKYTAKRERSQLRYSDISKNAPVDPSLLYENRFIPDMPSSDGSIDPAIERSVIIEEIKKNEGEANFSFKLPNLTQSLVVIGILLIFILYRIRIRKGAQKRH